MSAPTEFEKRLIELNLTYAQIELVKQAVAELVIPTRPRPVLIQQALQTGRPQQAAGYNGYAAAVQDALRALRGGKG